jgi:hypothetical protein
MQYMRGWRALVADPDWKKKILVASALFLSTLCIPIVGQVVLMGYLTLALRRSVQGQDSPLPRLDFDFEYMGKLLGFGFKPMIASMIYSLVIVPIAMVFAVVMMIAPMLMQSGNEEVGLIIMAVAFLLYMVAIMFAQTVVTIAVLRATLMDDLGAALKPKAVFAMTRLLFKELIIGMFVMMLIGMPLVFGGMLFFYVGLFPAVAVLMHIQKGFHAELYRVYLEKGGEPLPIGPMEVDAKPAGAPATF